MRLLFADSVLDTDARRVVRGGCEVHLSPKAFETLALLVEQRGRAVSKKELLDRIWPNLFVSDASLARVMTELRHALGDDPQTSGIIRTVHGYGYAFEAVVTEDALNNRGPDTGSNVSCVLVSHRQVFSLPEGEHIVGRQPALSVWLDSPRVSWRHARVVVSGQSVTIEDLGSKNGTHVNGERISQPANLQPGSEIRIGPFTLIFRLAGGPSSTETEMGRL